VGKRRAMGGKGKTGAGGATPYTWVMARDIVKIVGALSKNRSRAEGKLSPQGIETRPSQRPGFEGGDVTTTKSKELIVGEKKARAQTTVGESHIEKPKPSVGGRVKGVHPSHEAKKAKGANSEGKPPIEAEKH